MPAGHNPVPCSLSRAFSVRVRFAMSEHRVTVTALARAAGLSRNYLGKRIRDEAPWTLNDVQALCEVLGMPLPKF